MAWSSGEACVEWARPGWAWNGVVLGVMSRIGEWRGPQWALPLRVIVTGLWLGSPEALNHIWGSEMEGLTKSQRYGLAHRGPTRYSATL